MIVQLYLAMSCLQGRPMDWAFDTLVALNPDGIQLTAGNAPTYGFAEHVAQSVVPIRTHQGFHWAAYKTPVWDEDCQTLRGQWDSVHPPLGVDDTWAIPPACETCIEVQFPGRALGSGASIAAAMAQGAKLAVDVSHIYIQLEQGSMQPNQWAKLQDYENITEIHISANAGSRDSHQPLDIDTFGLNWAREHASAKGTPVILESYFHHLDNDTRQRQIEIARGV